jgi:hypothetical protein
LCVKKAHFDNLLFLLLDLVMCGCVMRNGVPVHSSQQLEHKKASPAICDE